MALEGSSRADFFRAFAREILPQGISGNAIIQAARDTGIGIQRSRALEVIRDVRAELASAAAAGSGSTVGIVESAAPAFRWGTEVQVTDEWLRYDGPHATLFQQTGYRSDDWLGYVIYPEDIEFVSQRLVVQDDDYIDPENPRSGYRTTQPLPADISPQEAARRLGIDPEKVARIIFDRP